MKVSKSTLIRLTLIVLGLSAIAVGLAVRSLSLALIVPIVTLMGGYEYSRAVQRGAVNRASERLPELVDEIIQNLRSGQSLNQTRSQMLNEVESLSLTDDDSPGWLIVACVEVLVANGGSALAVMARLRSRLADQVGIQRRLRIEVAQALASACMLASLPLLFGVFMAIVDSRVGGFYLYETMGFICVSTAVLLAYVGWCWMQRLVRSAVSGDAIANVNRFLSSLELIGLTLASGGNLHQAVALLAKRGPGDVAVVMANVINRWRSGIALSQGLTEAAIKLGPTYERPFAALLAALKRGGPVTELLQIIATDQDRAVRDELELMTRRLPILLIAPLVLCLLPAIIIGAVLPLVITSLRTVAV